MKPDPRALIDTGIEFLNQSIAAGQSRLKSVNINSLAFRLFAAAVMWILVMLPIAGLIIYSANHRNVFEDFSNQLITHAEGIAAWNLDAAEPVTPKHLNEALFEVPISGYYWQMQPADGRPGRRLVSNSLATSTLPSPYSRKIAPDQNGYRWLDVEGPDSQPLRILELLHRFGEKDNERLYSIAVAARVDWPGARADEFAGSIAMALAIVAIGILIATYIQIRFIMAPMRTIEQGLSEIRTGEADKLDAPLPSEIEPLKVELNALIDSNQDIIERARTQVGNLAHALKTPLAVIKNEADDRQSPFARKVSEQSEIMRAQITHYLDRARAAARVDTIGRVTEVQPVAESLQRALERIYQDKGVTIDVVGADDARFQGEQHDLEEMLGNLLDNACKWCTRRVRLRVDQADTGATARVSMLKITAEDDGPGLTAEQRAQIGKRGVRLDETTPGTGLGLSIVGDLATSYRGSFRLDKSQLGGLKIELELPAATNSSA